jgi:hypothetical protein
MHAMVRPCAGLPVTVKKTRRLVSRVATRCPPPKRLIATPGAGLGSLEACARVQHCENLLAVPMTALTGVVLTAA